jgi:hypothetical protein
MKKFLVLILIFTACSQSEVKKESGLAQPPAADQTPPTPPQTQKPTQAQKDSVSIEAKLAAAQDNSADVTEAIFEKGSEKLSLSDQKKISATFIESEKRAHHGGTRISRVIFLVWSDSEMPPENGKDLSDADLKLAAARGATLKNYMQPLFPNVHYTFINLAKQPTFWKKFIRADSVRIRESLETAGTGDRKASRAIVIMVRKRR